MHEELPELPACLRGSDAIDLVHCEGRRQVVGGGADPAYPRRDTGCLLDCSPDQKLLEAAEFHHAEVGLFHLLLGVERDADLGMPLDPRDRADGDLGHRLLSRTRSRILEIPLSSMIREPMVKG